MKFEECLLDQIRRHPSMQPQDIIKLCYQAAFSAEHLLNNTEEAEKYFYEEYNSISAKDMALYEEISPDVCRVNLYAWKYHNLPAKWLFRMFLHSANTSKGGLDVFLQYIKAAEETIKKIDLNFTLEQWNDCLEQYIAAGIKPVSHSSKYRDSEKPAYRIISNSFIRLIPILKKASELNSHDGISIIAIDGRAASGKTTMAEQLEFILDADVIHMDDFFLPVNLRSDMRLSEPGGNVHYERFSEEVLPYISNSESFAYRIFDCGIMDYKGERIIKSKKWRIVEGAYSLHPFFGRYADLKVFSDIEPDEQINRILKRNGEKMAEIFRARWIPLEEQYFSECRVPARADIVV